VRREGGGEGRELGRTNQDQRNATAVIGSVIASFQSHIFQHRDKVAVGAIPNESRQNDMFTGSFELSVLKSSMRHLRTDKCPGNDVYENA
jgi:hypothetical protein